MVWRGALARVVAACLVASLSVAVLPVPGSTPRRVEAAANCTSTWWAGSVDLSAGDFENPMAWAEGRAPGPGSVLCIQSGSVRFVGVTAVLASIDVAPGASLTLAASSVSLTAPTRLDRVVVEADAEVVLASQGSVSDGERFVLAGTLRGAKGSVLSVQGSMVTGTPPASEPPTPSVPPIPSVPPARIDGPLGVEVAGTLDVLGATVIGNGAVLSVDGVARFHADVSLDVVDAQVRNNGVLEVAAGNGVARVIGRPIDSPGAIEVRSGTLVITPPVQAADPTWRAAQVTVAPGARVQGLPKLPSLPTVLASPAARLGRVVTTLFTPFVPVTPGLGLTPTVLTFDVRVNEGSTGTLTPQSAVVQISNPEFTPVPVTWSGVSSSATLCAVGVTPCDAVVPPGSGVLQPGTNFLTIPYQLVADVIDEPDEFFSIAFSSGAPFAFGATTVTIVDDDLPVQVFTSSAPSSAGEGTDVTVTVSTTSAPAASVAIPVSLSSTTATIGSLPTDDIDPSLVPLSLVITPPMNSASFTVRLRDDALPDPGKSFDVVFGAPSAGTVTPSSLRVDILDNDPPAMFFEAAASSVAPASETTAAPVTFSVAPSVPGGSGVVHLPVTIINGTATLGSDFVVRLSSAVDAPQVGSGDLIDVPAAGGSVSLFVTALPDGLYEGPETFVLQLGRAGVAGEQSSVTVTIPDDDPLPTVSVVADSTVAEDAGVTPVNLRLSNAAGMPLSFDVSVGPGGAPAATAGSDFVAGVTRLTVPAGSLLSDSFTWTVIDDTDFAEPDLEQVRLGVGPVDGADPNPVAGTALTVDIADDDASPMAAVLPNMEVTEGATTDVTIGIVAQTVEPSGFKKLPIRIESGTAGATEVMMRQVFADGSVGPFLSPAGALIRVPTEGGDVVLRLGGVNDEAFELPEQVTLVVGRASVPFEEARRAITINDVEARPTVTVEPLDPHPHGFPESYGAVQLQLHLSAPVPIDLPFQVASKELTAFFAESGVDYVPLARTVVVPAGATTSAPFELTIIDDTDAREISESVVVLASLDSFPDSSATLEILSDDAPSLVEFERVSPLPTPLGPEPLLVPSATDPSGGFRCGMLCPPRFPLPIHRVSVTEGTGAGNDVVLDIPVMRRSGASDVALTFEVVAQSSTADASDFSLAANSVTIPPNRFSATVRIVVHPDALIESPEEIAVALQSPDAAVFGVPDDIVLVTIVDDDSVAVTPSLDSTSVTEGGFVTVSASIPTALDVDVQVPVTLQAGTATVAPVDGAGGVDVDTTGVPPFVVIPAGDTSGSFRLLIDDDPDAEPAETFDLTFGTPSRGHLVDGSAGPFTVTIVDNDPPAMSLQLENSVVLESVTKLVTLTATPTGAPVPGATGMLTLPLRVEGAFASRLQVLDLNSGADLAPGGNVQVPASGGSVRLLLVVRDDRAYSPIQDVSIVVGRPGTPGEQIRANVSMVDNEPAVTAIIETASPFLESTGVVAVNLRLSGVATVPITWHVTAVSGTADVGTDFLPFEHDITVPAGSTLLFRSYNFTILDNNDVVEPEREYLDFIAESAGFPSGTARLVIIDDDLVFAQYVRGPDVRPNEPVRVSVLEGDTAAVPVSLKVRLVGPVATTPTPVSVVTGSVSADGSDYSVPSTLVFAPGETEKDLVFSVLPDNTPETTEEVNVVIQSPNAEFLGVGADMAIVTINDDDARPVARFVRAAGDVPGTPMGRPVSESTTVDLAVELTGQPLTAPFTVPVALLPISDTPVSVDDLSVAIGASTYRLGDVVELVFQPGERTKTISVTALADGIPDGGEWLQVVLESDYRDGFGPGFGPVYDSAKLLFLDSVLDTRSPGEMLYDDFVSSWNSLVAAFQKWLAQFTLGSSATPPLAQPDLVRYFDVRNDRPGMRLPTLPSLSSLPTPPAMPTVADALAEICRLVAGAGAVVQASRAGACGGAAAPTDDLLQIRFAVHLADLARAAGIDLDALGPDATAALAGLASAVGLQSTGGLTGNLDIVLDAGFDGGGAYLMPTTRFALAVSGDLALSGSASVAGATASLIGRAATSFSVQLSPAAGAGHNLARGLDVSVTGTGSMSLDVNAGPLQLTWAQGFRSLGTSKQTDTPSLAGVFEQRGFDFGGLPARISLTGRRVGDVWSLQSSIDPLTEFRLGGFALHGVRIGADVGPGSLAGSGGARLDLPLPDVARFVDITLSFNRTEVVFDGVSSTPVLGVGTPEVVRFTNPFSRVRFAAGPGGLTGGVEVGADAAVLWPADPVGTASGLRGTLSSTGDLVASADAASVRVFGGASTATLAGVTLRLGPAAGTTLLSATAGTATFPALAGVTATVRDLTVSTTGRVGASTVEVNTSGVAASLGLGGVVPFDVTGLALDFPDRSDLDRFTATVTGRFNFVALGDLGGLTPRLGLGGPVVTPSSSPEQNRFTFGLDVASLARGVVTPLDVGPVTVGFDGLRAGDLLVGGQVTLGGYAAGQFVPAVGGALTIDGPAGSALDLLSVALAGTFTTTPSVVADLSGSVVVSGSVGPLSVSGLDVAGHLSVRSGPAGMQITAGVDRMRAAAVSAAFGPFVTLGATGVTFNPAPLPGGNLVVIPTGSVGFDTGIPALAGWGGTFRQLAIGRDFVPRLLPGFGIDVSLPTNLNFGLPDFLPVSITSAGFSLPALAAAPAAGLPLDASALAGLRLRVSGGIHTTPTWPIAASLDGLEIDLDKLVHGQFPITNLAGITMGVEPFQLPGDVVVGGGLSLGTVDVNGTTVFYGRIHGELQVAGIGGGADLVVTQYGPVLLKVTAPLGVPLGPTGLVLANVSGAAQFGGVGVPVPPRGDPQALLRTLTLPTDLAITPATIAAAVAPSVAAARPTWASGFSLALSGSVVFPAVPGLITGTASIGINLGLPTGPSDPVGVQLVGMGDLSTFGMSLGRAGLLIDLADPTAPSYDIAFASPTPGSPLALIMPARATFGLQLRTDGVLLGTVAGMRAFVSTLADGVAGTAEQLFDASLTAMAARLDAKRTDPLAVLLLDLDGNGLVSTAEQARSITKPFMFDRLLGLHGVPSLLPSTVDAATLAAAGRAAVAVMNQFLLDAGALLTDPANSLASTLPPGAAAAAFASLMETVRSATAAGLSSFGALFDPSFTITGAIQPTFLGLPVSDPTVSGRLTVDRRGLALDFETSIIDAAKAAIANSVPAASLAASGLLSALTLGVSDRVRIGARLPYGGIVDSLLGGAPPAAFQPLDPNWAVTIGGSLTVFGFRVANLDGIAFLPGQRAFLESKVQKLYALPPGTPIDPTRIPISSAARFENLVQYGGVLVTGSLSVPRLLTDPASQLAALPPPPTDPLQYPAWLEQVAAVLGQPDTPARVQMFLPGLTGVSDTTTANAWANSAFVEGMWNGRLLGVDLGRASMQVSARGLEVTGNFPLIGATATVVLKTGLLPSGTTLPSAGVEVSVDTAAMTGFLQRIGVPSGFVLPVGASGSFRFFTPGVDPASADPLLRFGGMHLDTRLDLPGLIDGAQFGFDVTPRAGGFDLHGSASVARIGPIAGVSISNATVSVDVVGGVPSVKLAGTTTVLGATATVSGALAGDLTGQLSLRLSSGSMNIAGVQLAAGATLTMARVGGVLRGTLSASGTATLPAWLVTATGQPTLAVAACVDTAGNAELALGVPAMSFGPGGLVRIGRAPGVATLPPGPAACDLPGGAPAQSATGPLLRLRATPLSVSAVVNGSLVFDGLGAMAGLSVSGSLNGRDGTGSLAVAFAAGSVSLSGFALRGSATAQFGVGRGFSMTIDGLLNVPGVLTDARVSGSADETGITSLAVDAAQLTLPPFTVSNPTARLVRSGAVYGVQVGATVSAPALGTLDVAGRLDSAGFGSLSIRGSALTIAGAPIVSGAFSIERSAAGTQLSASGRFSLFGVLLEVPSASVALSADGTSLSGSLTVRAVANAPLVLGGWSIGGTLRLAISGTSARVVLDNGTVSVPGWGAIAITADIKVPAVDGSFFSVALPAGGLRLGGAGSPLFASGSFRLAFKAGAVTLSVNAPSLEWRSGATVIARFTGPSLSVGTDGSVSASFSGFSAAAAGFAFTVPSLQLLIDPQGLNARLALGAGSITLPGLPTFSTPAISIGTASTFSVPLVASRLDLGLLTFTGSLLFERANDVFRLRMVAAPGTAQPQVTVLGLFTAPLPAFSIASDGTFSIDFDAPPIGPPGLQLEGASVHIARSGPTLADLSGTLTGGVLHLPFGDPVDLPTLTFGGARRIDTTFTLPAWSLGPVVRASAVSVRFRQLLTGVMELSVPNAPSVTVLGGSGLTLNELVIDSAGTFRGSVTGRLLVFGQRLASARFDLVKVGSLVKLSLPASRAATLDLGFLQASVSGFVMSDGNFDIGGSVTAGLSFPGFSFNGSVGLRVTSADGVGGSFNGQVCFLASCAAAGATLRSDGRLKGFLQIDLDGKPPLEVDIDWRVYLATGALLIDINRDGDWNDFGDVWIGNPTEADIVPPTMTQPPDISVSAAVPPGGRVAVYYTSPVAYDGTVSLPVRCTPVSGSDFAVGSTTVTCTATDAGGNTRTRSFTVTVTSTVTTTPKTALAGTTTLVAASGFAAASLVGIWVHSTPIFLGMYPVDAAGRVLGHVQLPASLPPGSHTLVMEGSAPGGAVRQYVVPIEVRSAELPPPSTDVPPDGGDLPATGGSGGWPSTPLSGAAMLLVGAVLVVIARRRRVS